jgi:integrase
MPTVPNASSPLLQSLFSRGRDLPELASASALKKMQGAIRSLSKHLGRDAVATDLNFATLDALSRQLEVGGAAATYVNLVSYQLRKLARLAGEMGHDIDVPRVVRRSQVAEYAKAWTTGELIRLIAAASTCERSVGRDWWQAFLLTTIDCGANVATLLGLCKSAWDASTERLYVPTGVRHLHRCTAAAIGRMTSGVESSQLFPWPHDPQGGNFSTLRNHFRELLDAAGLPSQRAELDLLRRVGTSGAKHRLFDELNSERVATAVLEMEFRRRTGKRETVKLKRAGEVFPEERRTANRIRRDAAAARQITIPEIGPRYLKHVVTIGNNSPRSLRRFFHDVYIPMRMAQASPFSKSRYLDSINSLRRFAGTELTLDGLSETMLAEFATWFLQQRISPATVSAHVRNIGVLWRFAYRKRMLDAELRDMPVIRQPKRQPVAWNLSQFSRLLASATCEVGKIGTVPADLFWPAFLMCMYDTGVRLSALLKARRADLDLESGVLFVPAEHQKQNADQSFRLANDTLAAIDATAPASRDRLFPYSGERQTLYRRFRRIIRRAGLPDGPRDLFHKIRRTSASHLAAEAGDEAARRQLGHSSGRVTAAYLDPKICGLRTGAELLPRPSLRIASSG